MAFFDDIKDDEPKAGQSSNNENSSTNNSRDRVKEEPPHGGDNLGEAPELPPIFFTYDPIKNKFQVRDKRGNVKSEFDVMTVNGADAYHLWKDGQTAGSDTSYTAYQKDIKGQDGKNGKNAFEEWQDSRDPNTDRSWEAYLKFFKGDNGKSAFEQWKEVHGEYSNPDINDFFNYFKGRDGKDAYEVWKDMGFHGDRQAFFEWLAGLVKAEAGKDGKTYYPHFDGYELYFTEDTEGKGTIIARKNLRGEQGRTYKPQMEGTTLHFDDGEGDKTDPIDLKGKDAFELWKEYHHKPDAKYEEYEDFFRGQNVKSDHSYLDIKDFTCPVQTIDTELIANVLDSTKSPDELIEARQEDIDNLRKEGEETLEIGLKCKNERLLKIIKTGFKIFPFSFLFGFLRYKNWAGWFKEFSWWCAGADRPLLRMCPGDHSKYTGIGTVILFTAIMAFFSSSIALSLVFPDDNGEVFSSLGIVCGLIWATMIFFLDRFITNTMYSDGKVSISKDEFIGGLPRILIAIFLGIVISAPLELLIFDKEIDTKLGEMKQTVVDNYTRGDRESLIKLNNELSTLNIQLQNVQTTIINSKELQKSIDEEKKRHNDNLNQIKINNPYPNKPTVPDDEKNKKRWETYRSQHKEVVANRERETKEENVSYAAEMKILNAQKEGLSRNKGEDAITALINSKQNEINIVKDSISKKEMRAEKKFEENKNGLGMKLKALHEIAFEGYEPWFYKDRPSIQGSNLIMARIESQAISADSSKVQVSSQNIDETTKDDYLYGAEHHKFAAFLDAILHSWWWFLFNSAIGLIMLLFILIDISPVLYKMMLADGVYDNYLHQEKLLAQDKIRLSLARMLRNIEKGELKTLSPFIMGKIYRKLSKYSTTKDGTYNGEKKDYKQHIKWEDPQGLNDKISTANNKVFEIVLDYKKRIVLASYAAWYRDMRDAMIGAKDDAEGEKITPEMHFHEGNSEKMNEKSSEPISPNEPLTTNQESDDSNDNGQ